MQSLIIAFAMYSRIPMPRADWNDKNMRYAFCWFPVIGLVIGLVTGAVFYILTEWQVGSVFRGVCLTAVPLWITGGIHLYGFMDTTDARSSYGDREKKLMILKDSHVGAFAVIGCGVYMMLSVGAWSEIDADGIRIMIMAFALERALSGLAAVYFKGARKDGMLTAFREPARKRMVTVVLVTEAITAACVMCYLWLPGGVLCCIGALLMFSFYYKTAMKEFGGTTGDLAGWFLQNCELVMLFLTVCSKYLFASI